MIYNKQKKNGSSHSYCCFFFFRTESKYNLRDLFWPDTWALFWMLWDWRRLSMRWPPSYLRHPHYFCLKSIFCNGWCPRWLPERTQCYSAWKCNTLDMPIIVFGIMWNHHNPVSGVLIFPQIESWAQLEKAKLWLITVCPYRWKGWSGIVGSSQSSHQFGRKWKFRNSKLFFFFSSSFLSLHVFVSEGKWLSGREVCDITPSL